MKQQIIDRVNSATTPFDKRREIENIAYSLAGPCQVTSRQVLLTALTGKQYPKAKAGVHEIMKAIKELTTP
jgi:hypothetical protein